MPCLSAKYNPNLGIFLNIAVTPVGGVAKISEALATAVPSQIPSQIQPHLFAALLDTGATKTCISTFAAQQVGLTPIGKRPMTSATHVIDTNLYLADLLIPFGKESFFVTGLEMLEFTAPANAPMQMLLGMDVLARGVLTLSFDGHFSFSL